MQTISTSAPTNPFDISGAEKVYTLLREKLLAGSHCLLSLDVTVTGTVMLEECVTVHKSTSLHGLLYVENDVQIGEYSQVGLAGIGALKPQAANEVPGSEEFTWIHSGVRIGHHAQIDRGVIIGQGAWLEPFSRVDCDVPAGTQAGGSPLILRGYLCSQCGSLLSPHNRESGQTAADLQLGAGFRSQQVELAAQQVQVLCRVCGRSHLFTSQQWRWVGRELPLGKLRETGRVAEPAGLRRFMKW